MLDLTVVKLTFDKLEGYQVQFSYTVLYMLDLTVVKLTFDKLEGCQVQASNTVSIHVGLNHH